MNLNEFKKEFDPQLNKFLQEKIDKSSDDKDLIFLNNYFEYLQVFIKDGKRIRPYIAYITYLSFGGRSKNVIKSLIFLEIFHYFCLVHDDIIDNSAQRHGIKTVNNKFGNSQALLIGDYLFSWTWELVLNLRSNQIQTEKLTKIFNEMIDEVFLGQILDVHTTKKEIVSNDLIIRKTLHKTAGYTFAKPMHIGFALADEYNSKNKKFGEELGKNLGLAYQLQDDMLDITSDFNGNKTPLSDISEGIHTIFSNYVIDNGTAEQKQILRSSFGRKELDVEKIRKVFIDSGAIEYGKRLIDRYLHDARNLSSEYKYFLGLINLISVRKT